MAEGPDETMDVLRELAEECVWKAKGLVRHVVYTVRPMHPDYCSRRLDRILPLANMKPRRESNIDVPQLSINLNKPTRKLCRCIIPLIMGGWNVCTPSAQSKHTPSEMNSTDCQYSKKG